jgi:hypothetical protein
MLSKEELFERAKAASENQGVGDDWGEQIELEEGGGYFEGRYRGETTDPVNVGGDGQPRRVYLFWDEDNHPRYMRDRTKLSQEIDRVNPNVGDVVAIYRAANTITGSGNTMHIYGVMSEPSDAPLPAESIPAGAGSRDPDIPF